MTDKNPIIQAFFDEATNTISYLVADPATKKAIIIDPVLDYNPASSEVDTQSVENMLNVAKEKNYNIIYVIETHAHADHLSGAPYVKAKTGAKIAIGEHIKQVQKIFRPVFNATDLKTDGSDFDLLLSEGQVLKLGDLDIEILFTPGHTPADISLKIGNNIFVGDTLFMPDYGTARADFPGGDANKLYDSIQKLLSFPDETRLFMCHDYLTNDRKTHAWESTVKQQKENIHLKKTNGVEEFVAMREKRDATLNAPKLLLPSIQVNIRAGRFPKAQNNGVHYLTIPVKAKKSKSQIISQTE